MINPTLPPTVAEFRAMFPQFAAVSDEQVQLYLDIAMGWVDTFWFPVDAKLAVMFAAAHYLYLNDLASGGTISSGGASGAPAPVDPELGKIWAKTVRFRDRSITYERVGLSSQKGGGAQPSSSDEFWESSPYGEMYLSYRRRNVAHVAVI
jgi:hypothetical protein